MRHIYLIACLVLGGVSVGYSQSQTQYIDAAKESFMKKDYYSALAFYTEALDFDSTDINLIYNAAESAREFSSYRQARDYYQKVVNRDENGTYPLAPFKLAEMYQMMGDYDNAKKYYNIYLSEQEGEDDYYTARAKKEISSADWATSMADQTDESVTISAYEGVNTPNSEFGAVLEDDGISYSSLAFQAEPQPDIPEQPISRILKTTGGASDEYSEGINRKSLHTAHTAYNTNRSKVFYTICEYENGSEIRCDLYSRAILGNGELGEEVKLPETINGANHTSTQPNVGFNQSLGKEVLYFASDRDGGDGGLDIWYVTIEGVNEYSDPMNLGDLNTAEDDITPFFHNNSQALYFSSLGYTSMGGFDVYRSLLDEGQFGKVENLGAPVNSSYNDVYYMLSPEGDRLLLSSNREGTQFIDPLNESCCYDIFEGEVTDLTINLNVLTFDGKTLDSLSGVKVQLFDAETGELVAEMENTMGNDHPFSLEKGKKYMVVSTMPGFDPDTMHINTNRIFRSEDITRKVYLNRNSLDLQVLTFDDVSKLPLPGTTVTLTDLTDGSVQVIEITNAEGHDFAFTVVPGHKYRLEASKDRFVSASTEFTAQDEDGSGIMVRKLFLERKDLNIYLPLALYFDNDRPDERTVSLTTDMDYTSTFDKYVFKKQEFKSNYAKGLSGSDKVLAEQRVDDFFETDVKGGFDKFQNFLEAMLRGLNKGKTYELSIRGYASPRADSRYNLALSQRRVVSVQNELMRYSNGAFGPYIENGQLKITQLSYGENLAPREVSDVFKDRQNSIYSPEASRERRAEIVEIKTQLINE